MRTAAQLRAEIESVLAQRIPSALTPAAQVIRPVMETGVGAIDGLLSGGFPVGAITEVVGEECSGRTTLALSFMASITSAGQVGAWVDVSDALDPTSAAANGVNLERLLWVRCGDSPEKPSTTAAAPQIKIPPQTAPSVQREPAPPCGGTPHPRNEARGLDTAIDALMQPKTGFQQPAQDYAPRCAEPQHRPRPAKQRFEPSVALHQMHQSSPAYAQKKPVRSAEPSYSQSSSIISSAQTWSRIRSQPWSRIDQALRVTDLLLQGGGFGAVVLDLAGIAPEHVSRIPLATWFRYRAAAERTRCSLLLLTQHACAKSSAAVVLRLAQAGQATGAETVFNGLRHSSELARQRYEAQSSNVVPLRKPPQSERRMHWQSSTVWSTPRSGTDLK